MGHAFKPKNHITREDVVLVTNRMLTRNTDEAFVLTHQNQHIPFIDLESDRWSYFGVVEATRGQDGEHFSDGVSETWFRLDDERL